MNQTMQQSGPSIESLVSQNGSQSAAVEHSRAVAEVQAAVTVAQAVPRDFTKIRAEMQYTCQQKAVAESAFYSMPRSGGRVEGSTVHLARELARIWGNLDYGVRELRRDDNAGESEIQAYAWDQEANGRNTRSFIVPHERMAKKQRQKLVDLGDIYLNNQNQGARAVRECIFATLPPWFVAEAEAICRRTLEQGEGEPLDQQVQKMLTAFRSLDVSEQMIADKLGKPRTAWQPGDLAQLRTDHGTITRGEAKVAEIFPEQDTVTIDKLTGEVSNA